MSGAHREESASKRNLLGFWLLGLLNNYGYVVFLSAAEDLIAGASGAVLLADILPTMAIKVTAPFWVHRVPYTTRILICGLFGLLSFLMAAAFEPLSLRLLGVAFASVCSGWGEVTFLALTSHYGRGAVGAWSSGTGFAGIAGAGWYLFLRSVLGASARLTLALGAVFPLFYVSTYLFLLTKPPSVGRAHDPALAPRRKGPVRESTLLSADAIAGREGRVTPPPSPGNSDSDDEVSSSHTPPPVWTSSGVGDDTPTDEVGDKHSRFAAMTTRERLLRIQPLILPYMLPLFLVYFAEYTINQGTFGALAFHDMDQREFYRLASFLYQVGVFVSRSSLAVVEIQRLWLLPLLQLATLGVFLAQGYLSVVHVSWPMALLVLWEGLLGGATYVNAFHQIRTRVDKQYREFSLSAASVSDTMGIVVAAFVAIAVECALLHHNNLPAPHCTS